jgi:hypothetical protein
MSSSGETVVNRAFGKPSLALTLYLLAFITSVCYVQLPELGIALSWGFLWPIVYSVTYMAAWLKQWGISLPHNLSMDGSLTLLGGIQL